MQLSVQQVILQGPFVQLVLVDFFNQIYIPLILKILFTVWFSDDGTIIIEDVACCTTVLGQTESLGFSFGLYKQNCYWPTSRPRPIYPWYFLLIFILLLYNYVQCGVVQHTVCIVLFFNIAISIQLDYQDRKTINIITYNCLQACTYKYIIMYCIWIKF